MLSRLKWHPKSAFLDDWPVRAKENDNWIRDVGTREGAELVWLAWEINFLHWLSSLACKYVLSYAIPGGTAVLDTISRSHGVNLGVSSLLGWIKRGWPTCRLYRSYYLVGTLSIGSYSLTPGWEGDSLLIIPCTCSLITLCYVVSLTDMDTPL